MEIKKGVLSKYLNEAVSSIADEGSLPDEMTGYYNSIINMKKLAAYDGELDTLRVGIDCLLLDPSLDAPRFAELYNIFDPDEMQEVLRYIRSVVWPDASDPDPESIKDVKII
jgi:hypothetical protein